MLIRDFIARVFDHIKSVQEQTRRNVRLIEASRERLARSEAALHNSDGRMMECESRADAHESAMRSPRLP